MRARVWSILAAVVLSAGLAGCIDLKVFPAEIPAGNLAPGWALDTQNSQSGTIGQEPIVRAAYHVNAYRDQGSAALPSPTGPGVALIVSVPDAPILDEQAEIQKRIDQLKADNNVVTTNPRTGSGTIGGQTVSTTVYDSTLTYKGQSAQGLAIDIPYKCGANGQNVRVFGYAITSISGLTQTSLTTWQELAGQADGGALGGMLTAVRCS